MIDDGKDWSNVERCREEVRCRERCRERYVGERCVREKRSERTQATIPGKKSTRLYSSSPWLFFCLFLGQEEKEGNIWKDGSWMVDGLVGWEEGGDKLVTVTNVPRRACRLT